MTSLAMTASAPGRARERTIPNPLMSREHPTEANLELQGPVQHSIRCACRGARDLSITVASSV